MELNEHSRRRASRLGAAALALLLVIPYSAADADIDMGCNAYLRHDYITAMREFRPLAQRGDTFAEIAVGWLYDNGLGVPHDDTEAVKWYLLAAKQGDARAQQYLGIMYATGTGVEKNLGVAEKWFRLSTEQGSSGGQYGLGVMYRDGLLGMPDPIEALKWFSLATNSGAGTPEGDRALADQFTMQKSMTAEQIDRASALVKGWKPSRPLKSATMCGR